MTARHETDFSDEEKVIWSVLGHADAGMSARELSLTLGWEIATVLAHLDRLRAVGCVRRHHTDRWCAQ
jgi:DNA-binding IclR family transcriptional regulator